MILVTGASGYIGKHLADRLRQGGHEVVRLYRTNGEPVAKPGAWYADLARADHVTAMKQWEEIPDTVVHLAGHVEIALEPSKPNSAGLAVPGRENIPAIYGSNVMMVAHILDFCLEKGVRHLIFPSSQTVYGLSACIPVTEESPCSPLEHYAVSKLCAEQILKVGSRQGINVTCLRFPGVFGEGRKTGTVYRFSLSAVNARLIRVESSVPIPYDVIHLEDLLSGFVAAVQHQGNDWLCLNLSYGESCSLELLAYAIAELVPGCRVDIAGVHQPVICIDSARARAVLGWQPLARKDRLRSFLMHV